MTDMATITSDAIAGKTTLAKMKAIIDTISPDGDESDCMGYAARLVEHMGLSMEERELHQSYMWDGHSFNANLPDRHILHDVAHWMLASPDRRSLPEFGLNRGPETDPELPVLAALKRKDEMWEETRAAILGILLQRALGMPCGLMAEEVALFDKGIPSMLKEDWLPAYTWLRETGMVDRDGIPAVILGMECAAAPRP